MTTKDSSCKWCGRKIRKRDGRECRNCRRNTLKQWAILQLGSKCNYCGFDDYPAVLQFHHRHPSQKKYELPYMFLNCSLENIKKELKKCHLICPTCHSIVHDLVRNGELVL